MSFRSRTQIKPVVPVRRSSSLTRANASPSSSNYQSRYGSTSGSSSNPLGYQNNYYSPYSSLDTYSPRSSGHFDYSSSQNKRRDSYGGSNSSLNKFSTSSPMSSTSSYRSPYKDRDRYSNSGSNSYTSAYSNRYTSTPYSMYENGVTTAGLSFKMNPKYQSSSSSSNLTGATDRAGSSSNLYLATPATVARSSSLREHERKSRTRNRKQNSAASQTPTPRSLSASSRASEGYESGGEGPLDSEKRDASENGEFIDYKALYEAEKAENDKLKLQLNKKDDELLSLKSALERFTNATTKNTLSEIEKRERRAMERKISELEEELKQMETLKSDNQRLKDENGALIRVISKLSK